MWKEIKHLCLSTVNSTYKDKAYNDAVAAVPALGFNLVASQI
jgi:hypothetical protein